MCGSCPRYGIAAELTPFIPAENTVSVDTALKDDKDATLCDTAETRPPSTTHGQSTKSPEFVLGYNRKVLLATHPCTRHLVVLAYCSCHGC